MDDHWLRVSALPPGRQGWTGRCHCGVGFFAFSRGAVEAAHEQHLAKVVAAKIPEQPDGEPAQSSDEATPSS